MRKLSAQTKQKISQALKGKLRKAGGKLRNIKVMGKKTAKGANTQAPPAAGNKPMVLKENEGFTGARAGTSTTRLNTAKRAKAKGEAALDRMGSMESNMTGYIPKSQQTKRAKQGEYTKNTQRFIGGK